MAARRIVDTAKVIVVTRVNAVTANAVTANAVAAKAVTANAIVAAATIAQVVQVAQVTLDVALLRTQLTLLELKGHPLKAFLGTAKPPPAAVAAEIVATILKAVAATAVTTSPAVARARASVASWV